MGRDHLIHCNSNVDVMPIFCDNESAICIANNGSYNPITKHVSIRYHFVHVALDQMHVELEYVAPD